MRIRISFDLVTPESAAEGGYEDCGWVDEEGIHAGSVRHAVALLRHEGPLEASSSRFHEGVWYTGPPDVDYHTGSEERRHFHIDASPRIQRRIYETLKQRKVLL